MTQFKRSECQLDLLDEKTEVKNVKISKDKAKILVIHGLYKIKVSEQNSDIFQLSDQCSLVPITDVTAHCQSQTLYSDFIQ